MVARWKGTHVQRRSSEYAGSHMGGIARFRAAAEAAHRESGRCRNELQLFARRPLDRVWFRPGREPASSICAALSNHRNEISNLERWRRQSLSSVVAHRGTAFLYDRPATRNRSDHFHRHQDRAQLHDRESHAVGDRTNRVSRWPELRHHARRQVLHRHGELSE